MKFVKAVLLSIGFPIGLWAQVGRTPTWARDIAPILYQNCVECHRPDQVAPFPMLQYEDAAKRAKFLARVTKIGFMPPWSPSGPQGVFLGERGLSEDEIRLIDRWAEGGLPRVIWILRRVLPFSTIGNGLWVRRT